MNKIVTWNVLHRVHAETHSEPAVERWPQEAARVSGVVKLVSNLIHQQGVEVVLLQEVSGDVLSALRGALPENSVLAHSYPRVPKQKRGSLQDPREHVVVIAPMGSKVVRSHTFESDPGKGFLMVLLPSGVSVATTHVSWGDKAVAQLALLAELFEGAQAPFCLGGDFNAERAAIMQAMGKDVVISVLPEGSRRTRPVPSGVEGPQPNRSGADIDHLLARHATLQDARVLEAEELSDHHPVISTLITS